MGAWMTERTATGKTASQAFGRAVREAREYSGDQDGYSGDLNSGGTGFIMVELPKGCSYEKFQGLLEEAEYAGTWEIESARESIREWSPGGFFNKSGKVRGWKGNLAKAKRDLAKAKKAHERFVRKVESAGFYYGDFEGLQRAYSDKWGDYLCVELSAHLAKKRGIARGRGERAFIFFGYSPC